MSDTTADTLDTLCELLESIELAARDALSVIGEETVRRSNGDVSTVQLPETSIAAEVPVAAAGPVVGLDLPPVTPIPVALVCKIYPHLRDVVRVAEVIRANGEPYTKLVLRSNCWDSKWGAFGEWEPQTEISGLVAAVVIAVLVDGRVIVEVLDGDIIAVDRCKVVERLK